MSREQSDVILQHPSIVGISRRRRLYATITLAAAILVILLICLSTSVTEFRAVQSLTISHRHSVGTVGGKSFEQTREQILQVVRNATSEQQLKRVVTEWTNRLNLTQTSGMLDPEQVDYEKLRARLTFAIEQDPSLEQITLHLGYTGRGNQTERAFLSLFTESVSNELALLGTPSKEMIGGLRRRVEQAAAAEQLVRSQFAELRQQLAEVEISVGQLKGYPWEQLTRTSPEPQRETEWVDPRVSAEESKVRELSQQRAALLQQYPEAHPEVLAVRRDLEQAQLKILDLQENGPKRISNQFVQASFPKASSEKLNLEGLEQLKSTITAINTPALSKQLDSLQRDLDAAIGELRESNLALCNALDAALDTEPSFAVGAAGKRVTATGSLNRTTLLWATLAAVLLGGVICSRFDVWSFDRGFESSKAAAESLAVPVFPWGNEAEVAPKRPEVTASSRILKLSEILLFTTLLVVAGMVLIDPEYRQAVLENPLHAFARLLWMWKS
jgi:hypothetical protein